jgi:hypothetical protein
LIVAERNRGVEESQAGRMQECGFGFDLPPKSPENPAFTEGWSWRQRKRKNT